MANAATHDNSTHRTDSGKPVRTFALVVGAVFLLVGILGFVPGITQDLDTIQLAGHESNAKLLGIFQVSVLHNLVHVAFGVAGLALARKTSTAVTYLVAGGAVYLVLFVYGIATDHSSAGNFVPLNAADDALHLVLGIAMIALGLIGRKIWRDRDIRRTV
ncbi:DUF4383 domain-containing protein [Nocardioides rubriscoriae]|uniref:DUF4383 domain-containing protein n=1 Tax=Nocardioides rubriscoriae TaxID=642762 RepID=UPI0011DF3100|nr:DUF4383 domain-containing protein [Nocardioides rubriscoriae]